MKSYSSEIISKKLFNLSVFLISSFLIIAINSSALLYLGLYSLTLSLQLFSKSAKSRYSLGTLSFLQKTSISFIAV
jgi:hypothetical protein